MILDKDCNNLNNLEEINSEIDNENHINSEIQSTEQIENDFDALTTVHTIYTGGETDNIIINVDNKDKVITGSIKQIQYESKLEFPSIGSEHLIYIDISENATYRWDNANLKYVCIGRDYNEIEIISGGKA